MNKRKCSVTGEYFSRGYIINDGDFYAKSEKSLLYILKNNIDIGKLPNKDIELLNSAYEEGLYYYTEIN
jgi:hypothetical protein